MRKLGLAALWLLAFSKPLPAHASSELQITDLAERSFSSALAEYDIPGLVVGVTLQGRHAFYATGLASREDNIPVAPDTIFELGSISKIFNVSLAALAEQRGKLDLDAPVSARIAELRGTAFDTISLMDLATHSTGGLPLQVPSTVQDVPGLIDWLAEWQPSQKGARSYSNVGIGLLGHITANALSKRYADAVEGDLFAKMGLKSTWVDVPAGAMHRYAFGYDRKTNKPIRVNAGVLDDEAYGVKSTAQDMLRFLDLELGQADAGPELKAALERTRQGQLQTAHYVQAMIWEQYPWPADLGRMEKGNGRDFVLKPQPVEPINPPLPPQQDVILSKTGSTYGFGAYVALLPGEDLGVVVLANRYYPNEARIRATHALIQGLLAADE